MDLRLINYFLFLCEEENFTAAAERLHITQPTLSKEIKHLEEELGKTLVIRGKRKISLTDEGMYLKRHGKEILALADKIESGIKHYDDVEGDVYIGAAETELFKLIATTIRKVNADYPHIRFHIHSGNSDTIQSRIDDGNITFGLIFSQNYHEKYHYRSLAPNNYWGIVMKADDPLAKKGFIEPKDVLNMPLYVSSREKSMAPFYSWAGVSADDLCIRGDINLLYNAIHLVKENCGYALTINGLHNNPDIVFLPLKPALYQFPKIIWKRHSSLSKSEEIFLRYLEMVIGDGGVTSL